MQEITKQQALNRNLKRIGTIKDSDMSKIILKLKRLEENKTVKYYCMEYIVFDPIKHIGNIEVSVWGD